MGKAHSLQIKSKLNGPSTDPDGTSFIIAVSRLTACIIANLKRGDFVCFANEAEVSIIARRLIGLVDRVLQLLVHPGIPLAEE